MSNRNFSTEHVKNVQNFRFFQVFSKTSQILGFAGKVATLYMVMLKSQKNSNKLKILTQKMKRKHKLKSTPISHQFT